MAKIYTARYVRRRRAAIVSSAVGLVAIATTTAVLALGGSPGAAGVAGAAALDAELQARFEAASAAAAAEGVSVRITSGLRSPGEQARLFNEAVAEYGSEAEASRWVMRPEDSAHVQGLAIDVGPYEGALWLESNGARFGLCRRYANETWHFEPLIEPGGECPEMLADSASG